MSFYFLKRNLLSKDRNFFFNSREKKNGSFFMEKKKKTIENQKCFKRKTEMTDNKILFLNLKRLNGV